jgi:hypothetical protein
MSSLILNIDNLLDAVRRYILGIFEVTVCIGLRTVDSTVQI